jgi:cytochrome b
MVKGKEMAKKTVRAWDLPTRLFHWTLLTLIIAAPLTAKYGDPTRFAHKIVGYAILSLVLWRVLWGFFGSSTARFHAFFPWPWKVIPYLESVLRGVKTQYLGHNPLGSVMVLLLLAAATAQGVAGLFTTDDIITAGPLYPLASSSWNKLMAIYHQSGFWIILGLALVHVLANLLYSAFSGINLIGAMVTGEKPEKPYADESEIRLASSALALGLLLFSILIVIGGIWIVGGDFRAEPSLF